MRRYTCPFGSGILLEQYTIGGIDISNLMMIVIESHGSRLSVAYAGGTSPIPLKGLPSCTLILGTLDQDPYLTAVADHKMLKLTS